jgi:hypothetical protein
VVKSTGWVDARWVGVLACTLLLASATASSAQASTGFGIERYGLTATEENASADAQAGSHPYALTAEAGFDLKAQSSSEARNLNLELPTGLTLEPNAVPRCTQEEFMAGDCPNSTAVGVVRMSVAGTMVPAAVYNLVSAPGELAQLGFTLEGTPVVADVAVRTGGDYGMTVSISNIPHQEVESVDLVLWGVPSEASHDALRGRCLTGEETACPDAAPMSALLTLPTSCAGSSQTTLQGESWGGETASLPIPFPQMTGCELLSFNPSISLVPKTDQASEPSGYTLDIRVPQSEEPAVLASAALRDATIVFPAGVSLAPSGMEGLVDCSEAEFEPSSAQPGMCPHASEVGTVELETPLLSEPLDGYIYMATPNANSSGTPPALYLEAQASGLLVKLAGQLTQNPATGQLTLTFEDLPQLPFGDVRLAFVGGQFALLANPPACGMFTATSDLAPWSAGPQATPSSSFQIATGAGGGPCPPSPSSPSSSSPAAASGSGLASTTLNASGTVSGNASNVTLAGARIAVSGNGEASIALNCAGTGTCSGKLTLTISRRRLGKGRDTRLETTTIGTVDFSIPAGRTTTVMLRLNPTGRTLFGADHGRLGVDLTVLEFSPAPAQAHVEHARLVRDRARGKMGRE